VYGTLGLVTGRNEIRDRHSEPCGQAAQGRDARIRSPLLNLDEHSFADATANRKFVEGLLLALAKECNSPGDYAIQLVRNVLCRLNCVSHYIDSIGQ
jgi:hypothetical protein